MVWASVLKVIEEESLVDIKPPPKDAASTTPDKPVEASAAKLNIHASEFVPRIQHNELGQVELNLNVLQRHFDSTEGNNKHEVPIVKSVKSIEQALFRQSLAERQQAWKDFPKSQGYSAYPRNPFGRETRVMLLNESEYMLAPRLKRVKRDPRFMRQDEPWDPELKSMYGKRFESEEKRREHERNVAVEALKLVEQRRMRAMEMEAGMFSADGSAHAPIRHVVHTPLTLTPEERERVDQLRIAKKQRIERVLNEMAINAQKELERQKALAMILKQSQPKVFVSANADKVASARCTKLIGRADTVDLSKGNRRTLQSCADVEKQMTEGQDVKASNMRYTKFDGLNKLQLQQQLNAIKSAACQAKYEDNLARIRKTDAPASSGEPFRRNLPAPKLSVQFEDELNDADKENVEHAKNCLRFRAFPKGNISVAHIKPFGPSNYRQHSCAYGEVNPAFKHCADASIHKPPMMKPHYVKERNEPFGYPCAPPRPFEPRVYAGLPPGTNPPHNTPNQLSPTSSIVDSALKPPEDKQKQQQIFDYARQLLKSGYQPRQPHGAGANLRALMPRSASANNMTNTSDFNAAGNAAYGSVKRTYDMSQLMKIKEDVARSYDGQALYHSDCNTVADVCSSHSSYNMPWLTQFHDWQRPCSSRSDPSHNKPFPGLKSLCPQLARSSKPPENVVIMRYTIPELLNLVPAESHLTAPKIAHELCKLEILRNPIEDEHRQ